MGLRLTPQEYETIKNRNEETKSAPRIKRADNKYKQQLELIFLALKCDVVREYKFHEGRKWRWDYWIVSCCGEPVDKLAIEYQGLNFGHGGASGHQTIKGIAAENEKYSEGAIAGWCIILVNAISVESGLAHQLIKRALDSRRVGYTLAPSVRIHGALEDL